MKKVISIFTVLSILFVFAFTAFAVNDPTLMSLADELITITSSTNENGTTVYTYTNIDSFIDSVRENLPEKTDREIAEFIMMYTGQEYNNISDNELLFVLDFDNISTTTSIIVANENIKTIKDSRYSQISPLADWIATDNKIKLSTNYSITSTDGTYKYCTVWTRSSWLKFPLMRLTDKLALSTSATFDDSVKEEGSISQNFYCESCKGTRVENFAVSKTKPKNTNIELVYDNFVPHLKFSGYVAGCKNCSDGGIPTDSLFSVFLKYGIIVNGVANIQSGYAYKTLGLGEASVGIDTDGSLSFSAPITAKYTYYTARAVTVK